MHLPFHRSLYEILISINWLEPFFKVQVQELTEELEAANERWEREQGSLKTTQRMHDKEERGMSREIQELMAITDQLRSSVSQPCHIMRSA